ncbi:MFS transporter, partial [Photobacterium damselae]
GLYIGALFWVGSAAPVAITIPYMQLVADYSAAQAGLTLIGMSLGTVLVAMLLPAKLSQVKVKTVCAFSLIGAAVSSFIMSLGLEAGGVNGLLILGQTLMGCSVGAMASQCSIIVTDALDPREAQQSGGIQATVRNIGYAVGIAIMGVTMLMVMTSDYKQQVAETTSFTQESKQTIEQLSAVPFLSDKEFTTYINEKNITETQEVSTAVSINSQVRLNAARAGLYAVAIFMLMFLFSLKNLPSRSLMIKKEHEVDEVFEQFER